MSLVSRCHRSKEIALPAVSEICEDRDIVLILDEVHSGITRTGTWFAAEHESVTADLVTMAEGFGGGLPIAAVTGRAELMDAVPVGGLGGTGLLSPPGPGWQT